MTTVGVKGLKAAAACQFQDRLAGFLSGGPCRTYVYIYAAADADISVHM